MPVFGSRGGLFVKVVEINTGDRQRDTTDHNQRQRNHRPEDQGKPFGMRSAQAEHH